MKDILFLAHRIPFPPDRGDKIRSWNLLKQLASLGRVELACLADDEEDAAHLPALREALGGRLGVGGGLLDGVQGEMGRAHGFYLWVLERKVRILAVLQSRA